MTTKNNPLIASQSSTRNTIQSFLNENASSLKMVLVKKTQNNSTDETNWVIKTVKCPPSPGISPKSKEKTTAKTNLHTLLPIASKHSTL